MQANTSRSASFEAILALWKLSQDPAPEHRPVPRSDLPDLQTILALGSFSNLHFAK